jgi:hypothetical protein
MTALFDMTSQRGKAQFSLIANLASRSPSVIGILFFVPLIYRELGDSAYGQLMAAISLGSISWVLFGGGYILGRRRIGEAMYDAQHAVEARAFVTLIRASYMAALLGIAISVAYALFQSWPAVFIVIAALQVSVSLAGSLDEARTAYNELYVPASARTVFQICAYGVGLTVAWVAQSPLLAALVMLGPNIAASLFSGVLLLIKRPYLSAGMAPAAWRALAEGLPIGLIDGLVMMAVNLSVVLVQAAIHPEGGAWYATMVRLFILGLAVLSLAVLPLTSYFRGIWNQRPAAHRARITVIWVSISVGFGALTALGLWIADLVYLGYLMGIEAPFPPLETLAIYVGLGAVATFKCFSAFGYMIMNTRSLNIAFGTVLMASTLVAGAGQLLYGTPEAVQWCSLTFAVGLVSAILWLRRHHEIEVAAD